MFSLKLRRYILMLRFWLKLTKSNEDRLVRVAYEEMLKCDLKTSWPSPIKKLLEKVGMPYLWNNGLLSRCTSKFRKPGTIYIRKSGNLALAKAGS